MPTAVELIAAVAPAYNAAAEPISAVSVILRFSLVISDGRTVPYEIEVKQVGDKKATAKERQPINLPEFCPQRHIKSDGSFCLYWREVSNLDISDEETAHAWWGILWKFLTLQARVKKARRWPNQNEWAHGAAAVHQYRAELAAHELGGEYVIALKERRLSVVKKKRVLQLLKDKNHLYSVWLDSKKVVNLKQRCLCGSTGKKGRKRLRRCGSHASDASHLAMALLLWEIEEKAFWHSFRDRQCCGTCDNCPLQP